MDLSSFDLAAPTQQSVWDQRFEALYYAHQHQLLYDPKDIQVVERVLPESGVQVRIALCTNLPSLGHSQHKHGNLHLQFRNTVYQCAVRTRPYSSRHFLVSCEALKQADFGLPQLELLLALSGAYGCDYEVIFNGVAPTWDRLHCQVLRTVTTIWQADLRHWPARVEGFTGDRREEVARRVWGRMAAHWARGCAADLLVRQSGARWHVILMPRRHGATRPPNALGNPDHFGTVGCLEQAGFWIACRTEDGFHTITANPAFYEEALQELSI